MKFKLKRKSNNHSEGIYSIDFYAYKSKINHWNPMFKVVFAFITLLICIIANNFYVSLIISFTMAFITVCKGKIHFQEYLSLLTIPITFMILGSIAIAIGISTRPIGEYNLNFHLFYLYSSNESILKTLKIMMKAFGAISAMYMMTLSTSASEIISVLRKIHVPKIIIELMNMIYRFIFILLDVQCKMKNSAQSRLGYVDFKTSCYSFGSTSGNLLIVSLKKANAYYDSMESRCYDGEMIFLEEDKKIETKQIVASVIYLISLIILWLITR
ncbi:cobalt ECF transporter T component CbiQ [Clostridium taeniosporum]|uniref:Cobalt ECF transporter T component CbiQ n=1 Tax=Clostridium taeniosporum TaxID=394958 RepID=A0A1D7XHX2_9CLOT|nr:cobalt ECF transporter T component CbiQ [Clostridium taeniosporum]AOR22770.1 cobalt ECF transporter T component CbiQ [Clostridium taeniosporum]